MPIAATIGAIGSAAGAGIGTWGAISAADSQSGAIKAGLAQQMELYNRNSGNLQGWINRGNQAGDTLASLYGMGPTGASGIPEGWKQFTNLPAYQFPYEQGMLALTRQLNASGKNLSGAQIRAAQGFGQGLASQYFMNNYVNPLYQWSEQGRAAAGNLAGVGAQVGTSMQGGYNTLGGAQASGIVGATNAITGGVSNLGNNLSMYSMMAQNPSSYTGYGNQPGQWNPNVSGGVMGRMTVGGGLTGGGNLS